MSYLDIVWYGALILIILVALSSLEGSDRGVLGGMYLRWLREEAEEERLREEGEGTQEEAT